MTTTTTTWIKEDLNIETHCVHAGVDPDPVSGAILTPIVQSTTFIQTSVEDYMNKGFSYSRVGNPTVEALEHKLAQLEGGISIISSSSSCKKKENDKGGATCFATGMAATYAVFAAFLKPGDHCVITDCSYGGTNRCARVHFSKYGIQFDFVDFRDLALIESHIKPNTRMIFSESPTNPILTLADIAGISQICKNSRGGAGGAAGILHVCDSTLATPLVMRPFDLGADIVIHSTTKFFDGHNMTIGGVTIVKNNQLDDIIKLQRNICGSIMSPQVAFYTLQTIKTLSLRLAKQSASALEIAHALQNHPQVEKVTYPGLDSYPQRALALRQHRNDLQGSMLSFEVKGGTATGIKLMNTIKRPWSLCENLGSCESIITCPAVFTHANMITEDRLKVGITDGLIRVSVGIEDVKDLILALVEALNNV